MARRFLFFPSFALIDLDRFYGSNAGWLPSRHSDSIALQFTHCEGTPFFLNLWHPTFATHAFFYFSQSAWGALRYAGRANADTLVTLSTWVAYLYSIVVCIANLANPSVELEVFFETSAILLTLILFGRFLEMTGKKQTSTAIKSLMKLQPATAVLVGKQLTLDESQVQTPFCL